VVSRAAADGGSLDWWASYFDDDYLLEHGPMFGEQRTRTEVARTLGILGLPVGGRLLDCPCGHGRHARLFAAAGFDVTGVDFSADLLRVAQRAGPMKGLRYTRGDMRDLPATWTGRFDAVVSLGRSFGFFATPADDERVIAQYARVLAEGGQLLLHMPNRDGVASRFVEKDWWEAADGTLLLHQREFDQLSGILTVVRTLRRGAKSERREYRLRLYTASDIAAMCARHGLIVTETFDGWNDRPPRRTSGEMVVTAFKER
jgi:SAM-dependent methyltransferase